jgi:hypothetical protein
VNRRRLLGGSLTAVLSAAAVGLQSTRWDYAEAHGPLATTGHLGEVVEGTRITAEATQIRLARAVRARTEPSSTIVSQPTDGRTITIKAADVFVVIGARVVAHHDPTYLWTAELHAAHRRYGPADVFDESNAPYTLPDYYTVRELQPARWRHGVFVFDVPVDVLPGAHLAVSHRDTWIPGIGRYREDPERFGAEIRIDLDIDDERVEQLLSEAMDTYVLRKPR